MSTTQIEAHLIALTEYANQLRDHVDAVTGGFMPPLPAPLPLPVAAKASETPPTCPRCGEVSVPPMMCGLCGPCALNAQPATDAAIQEAQQQEGEAANLREQLAILKRTFNQLFDALQAANGESVAARAELATVRQELAAAKAQQGEMVTAEWAIACGQSCAAPGNGSSLRWANEFIASHPAQLPPCDVEKLAEKCHDAGHFALLGHKVDAIAAVLRAHVASAKSVTVGEIVDAVNKDRDSWQTCFRKVLAAHVGAVIVADKQGGN